MSELQKMFAVLRPFTEVPSATLEGYLLVLGDLTPAQALMIVPLTLRKRWDFPPQPADLIEMIVEEESRIRTEPNREAEEDCAVCGGTGFKVVNRPDGNGRWALACECRKKSA